MRLDMDEIYQNLLRLRRDSYAQNQKIVVNHTDQDFFFHDSKVGFLIHNFLSIVRHVDIPLSQLLFLTTDNNLITSIKPFISHPNDIPDIHTLLVSSMIYKGIWTMLHSPAPKPKDLKFTALCMIGTMREHRAHLCKYIAANLLLDRIQLSVQNKRNPQLSENMPILQGIGPAKATEIVQNVSTITLRQSLYPSAPELQNLGLVFSVPPLTVEYWSKPATNPAFEQIINLPLHDFVHNPNIPAVGYDFYRFYAVDIVTETNFHYPAQFLTEKTFRPLLQETPFIMFGPANTMAYLRQWGFETFGDIWDESYDSISDPQDRFVACCQVMQDVVEWPLEKWKNIYKKIYHKLNHNRQTLLNYIEFELTPLADQLQYSLQ